MNPEQKFDYESLLAAAPPHDSPGFLDYLRAHNPVLYEDASFLVIKNAKYGWPTAFAKTTAPDFTGLLAEYGHLEWRKKTADKQTVPGRFHMHILPAKEPSSTEDWEGKFDEKFPAMGTAGNRTDDCIYRFDQYVKDESAIKTFIRSVLRTSKARDREKMLAEIESMKRIDGSLLGFPLKPTDEEYNLACDDIIRILQAD